MNNISDFIYERSVVSQLSLYGKKGGFFSKNGSEATIIEDAGSIYAEASSCLMFMREEEPSITEKSLTDLQRKLLLAGSDLKSLRVEFTFLGEFAEDFLRLSCNRIGEACEKMDLILRGIGVHKEEKGEGILIHLIGGGSVKSLKEAPWQNKILIPGQGIVVTGSIGRAGSLKLFKTGERELMEHFPNVFIEKMRNRVPDRLPYIEIEMAPFFGVTSMSFGEEGGLLAALHRLGRRGEAGFRIYSDRLFYDQETIEIAEYYNQNPLELSSEGVYVMAVNRAEDFVESLRAAGLPAVLAGEVTEEKKRVILFGEEERFIEGPRF